MDHRQIRERGRAWLRKASTLLPKRLRLDQSGAVAVEFGIVALPFFTLIFAILQLGLVFATDQLLETAVADAARMIRTGQAKTLGWDVNAFNRQVCTEMYYLITCSTQTTNNTTSLQTYIKTASTFSAVTVTPPINPVTGAFNATPSYDSNANSASQIVVVSTFYEFPTLFSALGLNLADQPNGTRLLGAVAAFRNEPFP